MAYINHKDLATLNELLDDNLTAWEGEDQFDPSEGYSHITETLVFEGDE